MPLAVAEARSRVAAWPYWRDEASELCRRLVRQPSVNPPGEEGCLARFLVDWFRSAGVEDVYAVEILPGRSNVLARVQSNETGPRLIFNAHLDVVPPGEGWTKDPFGGASEDGRIWGRGSADMKGGLAAMLTALRFWLEQGLPLAGEIVFAGVIDEEFSNLGMRRLVQDGLTADYAIIGEPTGLAVNVGHRGFAAFRITTHGKACHASHPEEGHNAIYDMARVVSALQAFDTDLSERCHPHLGSASLSVGTIAGGSKVNVVPDACSIEVDRRLLPGESVQHVEEEIATLIAKTGVSAQLETLTYLEPAETNFDQPLVREVAAAAEAILGRAVPVQAFPAGCEASFLVQRLGIPTVIFGPGNLVQAHKPDEWVSQEEVARAAQIYALLCARLLR